MFGLIIETWRSGEPVISACAGNQNSWPYGTGKNKIGMMHGKYRRGFIRRELETSANAKEFQERDGNGDRKTVR